MGFGGGGSAGMTNHVHNSVPLQGGPLDFTNNTIASLNAGSTTFSDGAALQELVIGNPADALVVNGAGTAPEWGAGATGPWTLEGTDSSTTLVSSLNVAVADKSFYSVYYHVSCAVGDTGSAAVRINGVTSNYEWITTNQYATTPELHDSTSDSQILMHPEITNNTCYGTVNIFKSDSNARETGITTSSLGGNTANGIGINYWSSGTGWTATTAAVSNITIFMSGGTCLGGMSVMSADF